MKTAKRKRFTIIIGIFILISGLIFGVVCTVIANSVISEMADLRVEINGAELADYQLEGEQASVTSSDG
ncbi:MAG: hypothetical protein FH749_07135 [Firmicutes bacterium]|nr:hypothetical protein [Bacillota bacterium]